MYSVDQKRKPMLKICQQSFFLLDSSSDILVTITKTKNKIISITIILVICPLSDILTYLASCNKNILYWSDYVWLTYSCCFHFQSTNCI